MKGRPDFYWRQSKSEGYPARSVYKLSEMQEKFHLIRPASAVLDLGSSPGSWSLFMLDILSGAGSVTGVDLDQPDRKLLSRKGFAFIQGDFTTEEVLRRIEEIGPFGAVVSDAAPSTSGNRTRDTVRSLEIGRRVLLICGRVLAPGGNMALKIFQGGEEREVFGAIQKSFRTARTFKPKASRSDSMEIYFVGCGFLPIK